MASVVKKPNSDWNIESLAIYVSEIVSKESGNILGANQISMVITRISKRLIDLGQITPKDYHAYLTANYSKEVTHLVTILTTHHTFFFREFCHFEYLQANFDKIVERVRSRGDSKIRILAAACSRGQEVYSLAMFFEKHLQSFNGISYEVIGTDIDIESVGVAKNGVYPYKDVKAIPQMYLSGNWQRGTGEISQFAKVKAHLRGKTSFNVMNLLSPESVLNSNKFDIIFCRNVFIYFEQDTICKIVNKLKTYLYPSGLFITGLSESLKTLDIYKNTHAPSVYSFDKIDVNIERNKEIKTNPINVSVQEPLVSVIPKPIKVLVVDDSKSILKLLGRIFESDPDFKLVGTASNGVEAEEFLKTNKVDAMTLDIHMPEMDGVEYLKKNHTESHPHVIVVSSASREDTRYAQETIKYGACDFVEKPALNNLSERAEEITNKIKMAFFNSKIDKKLESSFKNEFKIKNVDNKARVCFSNFSDLKKITRFLEELKGEWPPVFLFFEGNNNYLEIIKEKLGDVESLQLFDNNNDIAKNNIYICDFKEHFDKVEALIKGRKISVSVFGICSKSAADKILNLSNLQLLLEDLPDINCELKEIATDVFPWTSFFHVGTEFLAKD